MRRTEILCFRVENWRNFELPASHNHLQFKGLKSGFLRESRRVFPASHRFGWNLVGWLGATQKVARKPYFGVLLRVGWFRAHFTQKYGKNWKLFFDYNPFPLGFSKKLVCIRYQDLASGYAHVKFQPDCSKGVDSTAIGRFETFSALVILCLDGSPSSFVCSNAWGPRSFWQILSQSTFSEAEIWPKRCFFTFFQY